MQLLKTSLSLFLLMAVSTLTFAQDYNITFRSKLSFPNQTVANVCGWASPDGKEYALVGASSGLNIVDVTNPDAPVKIIQVPGPNSFWKEIKTYSHYAYIVTEGGQGVQIVNLSGLPAPNVAKKFYKGDGDINGALNSIHALHIDQKKGFLYAFGTNLVSGGAVVLDLNDPWNPKYVGKYDQLGYIHDGYVDNDTLYAAHIDAGYFAIVDMTNKAAPVVLNTQNTPTNFTHNTWLSDDRKTLLTTDETANSFLAAYDVSNPDDIQLLDKMQTNPGSNSIVHNTHIRGNYAVTAWYTEGVNIVDITKPEFMVETGHYDTYPQGSGSSFDGCWGVYPYLPSGNLVVGNIDPGELWILTPTYQRACYLEGKITDAATGLPIAGATVKFVGNNTSKKNTGANGIYRTGQAQPGMVSVQVSKYGYLPVLASANLVTGEVTTLDVALQPATSFTVNGKVVRADNGQPVPNARVSILSVEASYHVVTATDGTFSVPNVVGWLYDVVAGNWGYRYGVIKEALINSSQPLVLELETGYQDDFVFDYGWETSGTSATGQWERADDPEEVNVGVVVAPGDDISGDIGYACFVTGNGSAIVDADDVEDGTAVLTSPVMDLSGYTNPRINAKVWFLSANFNQIFEDSLKVFISNGVEEQLVWARLGDVFEWQDISFKVKDFVSLSSTMRLRVECFDAPGGGAVIDTYEAAFDQFEVVENPLSAHEPYIAAALSAMPNPFGKSTLLAYEKVETGARLRVFNLHGQLEETHILSPGAGQVAVGASLPAGIYFVRVEQANGLSKALKLVKTH